MHTNAESRLTHNVEWEAALYTNTHRLNALNDIQKTVLKKRQCMVIYTANSCTVLAVSYG